MKIIECSVSELRQSSFCFKSINLWREAAGNTTERGYRLYLENVIVEALVIYASSRVWIPLFKTSSINEKAIENLIEHIKREAAHNFERMEIFVESDTNELKGLTKFGAEFLRRFPVQMTWDYKKIQEISEEKDQEIVEIKSCDNIDLITRLFEAAFAQEWSWYLDEITFSIDDKDAALRRFIEGADEYFVAYNAGEAIGISSMNFDKASKLANFHTGVGVLPTARGLKVGGKLTRHSLRWAAQRGAYQVEVRTQEIPSAVNHNIAMYSSCGASKNLVFEQFSIGNKSTNRVQ